MVIQLACQTVSHKRVELLKYNNRAY